MVVCVPRIASDAELRALFEAGVAACDAERERGGALRKKKSRFSVSDPLAFSVETVAGLHSIVHSSAPKRSNRSIASKILRHCSRLRIEGVPPPKKMVLGFTDGATNSISQRSAST